MFSLKIGLLSLSFFFLQGYSEMKMKVKNKKKKKKERRKKRKQKFFPN